MTALPQRHFVPLSEVEQIREARQIIQREAEGLLQVARRVDTSFAQAVRLIVRCPGEVIVTGIGKAGLIGQKLAATFLSTGTRARFLHPAEAVHGDLGCVSDRDVVLALSNSGESEEVCRLVPLVRRLGAKLVAVTGDDGSTLARSADVVLCLGRLPEAGPIGLAPTTSTTAMLALGDALALVVSRLKGFSRDQFGLYHPGGHLGRRLTPVTQVMRKGDQLRTARTDQPIREVLVRQSRPGRRTGAVLVVDDDGRLAGLFTDSDLARLLEQRRDEQLDRPIGEVMTRHPVTIGADALLEDAVQVLSERKLSELPVVDDHGRVLGLIDITDVIGLMPKPEDA